MTTINGDRPWREMADTHRRDAEYLRRLETAFGMPESTRDDLERLADLFDDVAALAYHLDAISPSTVVPPQRAAGD